MKYIRLGADEGYYTLAERLCHLKQVVCVGKSELSERRRYEIDTDTCIDLLGCKTKREALDLLGGARSSYGVGIYCLTSDKSSKPRFWLGHY